MVYIYFGKICSGKTTYAKRQNKLVLSVDDIMNLYNSECEGPIKHRELALNIIKYLLNLIKQLKDIDIILDYGFWYKEERKLVKEFLDKNHIKYQFVLFECDDNTRYQRLIERNKDSVRKIDINKCQMFDSWFEEIDEDYIICNTN